MVSTRGKYSNNTLKDTYYDIILQRVIRDEYKSGDIITEKSLVDEFNVSKSPIREALISLCNERLLKSIPRFGYEVVSISEKAVSEMLDYRVVLECGYLARNWAAVTVKRIAGLEELLHKDWHKSGQSEALEHWRKNCNFHLALFSFWGNAFSYERLADVMRTLGIVYVRSHWKVSRLARTSSGADYHKQLINYFTEGDKEAALECLEKDIAEFFTPGV